MFKPPVNDNDRSRSGSDESHGSDDEAAPAATMGSPDKDVDTTEDMNSSSCGGQDEPDAGNTSPEGSSSTRAAEGEVRPKVQYVVGRPHDVQMDQVCGNENDCSGPKTQRNRPENFSGTNNNLCFN